MASVNITTCLFHSITSLAPLTSGSDSMAPTTAFITNSAADDVDMPWSPENLPTKLFINNEVIQLFLHHPTYDEARCVTMVDMDLG